MQFNNHYLEMHAATTIDDPIQAEMALSEITVTQAQDINIGDYWLYPVVEDTGRCDPPDLLRDPEAAWLIGLWLGDGHIAKRGIGLSFDRLQVDLIERAKNQLERMGYRPKFQYHPTQRSTQIEVHSVALSREIEALFGKGAFNKRLPFDALYWPREIQEAILDGYYDADGSKGGSRQSQTRSEQLANGLYALSIQCGRPVTLSVYDFRDKPLWSLGWPVSKRIGRGFFCSIGDQKFYWTPVTGVDEVEGEHRVIDVEVERTHSFVTAKGVTHNCQSEFKGIRARSTKGFYNVIWRGSAGWQQVNQQILAGNQQLISQGQAPRAAWTLAPIYKRNEWGSPEKDQSRQPIILGYDDGVFLWKASKTVHDVIVSKDGTYQGLSSRDFTVRRQGATKDDTVYYIEPLDVNSGAQPMSPEDQALAAKKYNLVDFITPMSYDSAAKILSSPVQAAGPQGTFDRGGMPPAPGQIQQGTPNVGGASPFAHPSPGTMAGTPQQ